MGRGKGVGLFTYGPVDVSVLVSDSLAGGGDLGLLVLVLRGLGGDLIGAGALGLVVGDAGALLVEPGHGLLAEG